MRLIRIDFLDFILGGTKKRICYTVIFVFFIFTSACSNYDYNEFTPVRVLGYCPTMKNYAIEYARNNNFMAVEVETTSIALENLRRGNLDAVIVGRKAYRNEIIPSINEVQLEEGYTLISNEQNLIQEFELNNYIIHTYLDSSIAEKLLPNSEIVYYENFEFALVNGISGYPNAMLINWRDYSDGLELLIPMVGINKVPEFRTPFLYYLG